MPRIGTCRLCQTPNIQLRDSHIIPGWAYERIRQQAAVDSYSKNKNPLLVKESGIAVQVSNEIKEYMLCDACEQKFSIQENWFKQLTEPEASALPLLSRLLDPNRIKINDDFTLVDVGQLDTAPLVFFALSVFWRAHECTTDETLRGFKLRDYAAEAIRKYLLAGEYLPMSISLWASFLEEIYIRRPGLISAFKTPSTADGHHVFAIAGMIFDLQDASESCDQHLCLLHAVSSVLIIQPAKVMVGPMLERAMSLQPRGSYRSYLEARKARRA